MIFFRDIIGHDDIIKGLKGALKSGRVSHAYLFSGPEGVGKYTTAMAYAASLLCSRPVDGDGCGGCGDCRRLSGGVHPELEIIRPEGATVKISQIRQLGGSVRFGPSSGSRTVRIVDGADLMTAEAANSMLRILEEPLPGVVFILVSSKPQAVLPTIVSRCQNIYFEPLSNEQLVRGMSSRAGESGERLSLAAALAGGSLGRALGLLAGGLVMRDTAYSVITRLDGASIEEVLSLAGEVAEKKEDVVPLLDLMILWFRDVLLYNETGGTGHLINFDRINEIKGLAGRYTTGLLILLIGYINSARDSLAAGANVQLTLEVLFIRLAGLGPEEVA
ncbi:MAG: DNA polymerase III subunit delta' [Bacillota bacterium]